MNSRNQLRNSLLGQGKGGGVGVGGQGVRNWDQSCKRLPETRNMPACSPGSGSVLCALKLMLLGSLLSTLMLRGGIMCPGHIP